jgi:hypothetical protein
MSAWNRRGLTIPPDSWRAWTRLAVWQFWMGLVIGGAILFGVQQITTAPDRIVSFHDFTTCPAATQATGPCERIYRTGGLNALFSLMCGGLLFVIAAWLIWELWLAVKPRPIADDFLKLLHQSFSHHWRNPRRGPWARVAWAYGFASLGAAFLIVVGLLVWSTAASESAVARRAKSPPRVSSDAPTGPYPQNSR